MFDEIYCCTLLSRPASLKVLMPMHPHGYEQISSHFFVPCSCSAILLETKYRKTNLIIIAALSRVGQPYLKVLMPMHSRKAEQFYKRCSLQLLSSIAGDQISKDQPHNYCCIFQSLPASLEVLIPMHPHAHGQLGDLGAFSSHCSFFCSLKC